MSFQAPLSRFHALARLAVVALFFIPVVKLGSAQTSSAKFRAVALAEAAGIHKPFVDAAKVWLQKESAAEHFAVDYIQSTDPIDDAFLSHYQLFIQLNYPPYGWTPKAVTAFTKFIEEGRGGWIGFHHATLQGLPTNRGCKSIDSS